MTEKPHECPFDRAIDKAVKVGDLTDSEHAKLRANHLSGVRQWEKEYRRAYIHGSIMVSSATGGKRPPASHQVIPTPAVGTVQANGKPCWVHEQMNGVVDPDCNLCEVSK